MERHAQGRKQPTGRTETRPEPQYNMVLLYHTTRDTDFAKLTASPLAPLMNQEVPGGGGL